MIASRFFHSSLREIELHTQEILSLQSSLRQRVLTGKFKISKQNANPEEGAEEDYYKKIFKSPLHDSEFPDSGNLPSAERKKFDKSYLNRDTKLVEKKQASQKVIGVASRTARLIQIGKKLVFNALSRLKNFIH